MLDAEAMLFGCTYEKANPDIILVGTKHPLCSDELTEIDTRKGTSLKASLMSSKYDRKLKI